MLEPLKIYFAGDLFDHKDLIGNVLLAAAIEKVSQGKYRIMLPQNGESEVNDRTSRSIRDADFQLLFGCDIIVANFDGTDLDSGTVVEFCFAKMLDMPALLLRTDFRDSGDNTLPDGEPWNLMCSHYPRTAVLHLNSMEIYHEYKNETPENLLDKYYTDIAQKVVAALDSVCAAPSWLKAAELTSQYERTIRSIGGTVGELIPENLRDKIVKRKAAGGLYN